MGKKKAGMLSMRFGKIICASVGLVQAMKAPRGLGSERGLTVEISGLPYEGHGISPNGEYYRAGDTTFKKYDLGALHARLHADSEPERCDWSLQYIRFEEENGFLMAGWLLCLNVDEGDTTEIKFQKAVAACAPVVSEQTRDFAKCPYTENGLATIVGPVDRNDPPVWEVTGDFFDEDADLSDLNIRRRRD